MMCISPGKFCGAFTGCAKQVRIAQGITAIAQRFEPVLILADCIQVTASSLYMQHYFACFMCLF